VSTQPPLASMAQPPDENDGDLTWMRESPFRPPDWRWRLAQLSLKEKLPRRPETRDPWVRRIAGFLRAGRERTRSRAPRRGSSFDTALVEAARIRFAADPLIAGEMGAWVLADEPISLIAKHCGLAEGVVETYEKCFFDARTRLEAKSYINHIVLGPSLYTGFDLENVPAIWRVVGYYRGRFSLAVALAAFPGSRVRRWPDWYEASPEEQAMLIEACRRAVFTRCLGRVVSSVRNLRLVLELRAAFEAKHEERSRPLGAAVPLLSSEDLSPVVDMTETDEPVPSPTQPSTVTNVATAQQSA